MNKFKLVDFSRRYHEAVSWTDQIRTDALAKISTLPQTPDRDSRVLEITREVQTVVLTALERGLSTLDSQYSLAELNRNGLTFDDFIDSEHFYNNLFPWLCGNLEFKLPVCSYNDQVRFNHQWTPISQASPLFRTFRGMRRISHGLCPPCYSKAMSELLPQN